MKNRSAVFAVLALAACFVALPEPASATSPCTYTPARFGSGSPLTQLDKNNQSLVDVCAYLETGGNGAANGTGVVATETGSGAIHKTVLTFTAVSITMTDHTTAGNQGSLKIYDFPEGVIQDLGCTYNLTTLAGVGGITDTAALVGSIGSVTAGAGDATLTSTEADFIASTSGTLSGGAGTLKSYGSLVAAAFDGHTTPIDLYLNLAVPDAGSSASDTVVVNGTAQCDWLNLGDN